MINKTEDYEVYEKTITYEDGECWDFIGYRNKVPMNKIIAKGLNFQKTVIEQDEDDWLCHIVYAQVIEQDEEKTILHDRLLTNYHTDDVYKFEIVCDTYYTIKHNKPLSEIKKDYKKEKQLFSILHKLLLEKGYEKEILRCANCDYCCDCLNRIQQKYEEKTVTKQFNDNQTIGEVKKIFDKDCEFVKYYLMQFFNAKFEKHLYFTEDGAIGEITIKHYIK